MPTVVNALPKDLDTKYKLNLNVNVMKPEKKVEELNVHSL